MFPCSGTPLLTSSLVVTAGDVAYESETEAPTLVVGGALDTQANMGTMLPGDNGMKVLISEYLVFFSIGCTFIYGTYHLPRSNFF